MNSGELQAGPLEAQVAASGQLAARPRPADRTEEWVHTATHLTGALGALAALPWLVSAASASGDGLDVAGAVVFGLSALALYSASSIYHALPRGGAKDVAQVVDHAAIFLLIAGTTTPFTLGALRGPWGSAVFAAVWLMALAGVVLKARVGVEYPRVSTALYLGMGWTCLIAVLPEIERIPAGGLGWLAAGGAAYTLGVPFFIADSRRFNHAIWHVFVLAGTGCHLTAVVGFAASGV